MMRKWEDIVKDKLEEVGGSLPEGVFAEFCARRSAAASASAQKRFPLVWAVIPAVAAGLAAVLLLRRPGAQDKGIRIIPQPAAPVAVATDSLDIVVETVPEAPLVAQAFVPKGTRPAVAKPQRTTEIDVVAPTEEAVPPADPAGVPLPQETTDNAEPDVQEPADETPAESLSEAAVPPFVPEDTHTRAVKLNVGPVAGVIAGGGLLAALVSPVLGATMSNEDLVDYSRDPHFDPSLPQEDRLAGVPVHSFPLRLGVSVWIPIADRLYISTGLDYSMYQSVFRYSLSGKKKQTAMYLGLPLRLDWKILSGKRFAAYVGAGVEGEICLGAFLAGNKTAKDGASLSLIGAGGAQMNVSRRVGIYVEPSLSLQVLEGKQVLGTYRSAHSLMPSVTVGVRMNLDKQ